MTASVNRRTFVVAGLIGSSLQFQARATSALKVIYVGGWDCPPCTAWKNKYKTGWLASPECKQVTWIEVESPKLKEAYQAPTNLAAASGRRFWPSSRSSSSSRFVHRRQRPFAVAGQASRWYEMGSSFESQRTGEAPR